MGDEADADWQAGLLEWGAENAGAPRRPRLTMASIASARRDRMRSADAKPYACPLCRRRSRTAGGIAQHKRDVHGIPL